MAETFGRRKLLRKSTVIPAVLFSGAAGGLGLRSVLQDDSPNGTSTAAASTPEAPRRNVVVPQVTSTPGPAPAHQVRQPDSEKYVADLTEGVASREYPVHFQLFARGNPFTGSSPVQRDEFLGQMVGHDYVETGRASLADTSGVEAFAGSIDYNAFVEKNGKVNEDLSDLDNTVRYLLNASDLKAAPTVSFETVEGMAYVPEGSDEMNMHLTARVWYAPVDAENMVNWGDPQDPENKYSPIEVKGGPVKDFWNRHNNGNWQGWVLKPIELDLLEGSEEIEQVVDALWLPDRFNLISADYAGELDPWKHPNFYFEGFENPADMTGYEREVPTGTQA